MKAKARVCLAALLLAAGASRAGAEGVSAALNVDVPSSYVWRGVTFNNQVVAQPSASLTMPATGGSLTGTVWTSFEPIAAKGDAIAQRGFDNAGLAEVDWTLEWTRAFGRVNGTAGAAAYTFQGTSASASLNTAEIYGKASFDGPLAPSVGVWADVDAVKGVYVEASVGHAVPLGASAVELGATAGWSLGQGVNAGDPAQLANFAGDGLTHADLSARMKFAAGSLAITPVVHAIVAADDFARRTSLAPGDQEAHVKFWTGVSFGWSH